MKLALEVKLLLVVLYIAVNGVIYNYAFYCTNQKSNVWLTGGIAIAVVTTLLNIRFARSLFAKLTNSAEAENNKGEGKE